MTKTIENLIEQILLEEFSMSNINVYVDLDGVLAAFSEAVHKNPKVQIAEEQLEELLHLKSDLADLHHDDLKSALKGPQEDPIMKKIKKAFNRYRGLTFKIASEPGHFLNLDVLPGAIDMLKTAKDVTGKLPHILTAPMETSPHCKEEKYEWVNKNLSGLFDEFHCTQNKEQFAKSKFDILIDDRPKYVNKFRSNDGSAILHVSPVQTIREFEELVKDLKAE